MSMDLSYVICQSVNCHASSVSCQLSAHAQEWGAGYAQFAILRMRRPVVAVVGVEPLFSLYSRRCLIIIIEVCNEATLYHHYSSQNNQLWSGCIANHFCGFK